MEAGREVSGVLAVAPSTISNAVEQAPRGWGWRWMVAFIGFPLGGLTAQALISTMETPIEGVVGGAAAGAVIGGAGALAMRGLNGFDGRWIAATSVGMSIGLGASVALFGSEVTTEAIALRGVVTGAGIGVAQAWLLSRHFRGGWAWLPLQIALYPMAWIITTWVIRSSVNEKFVVFSASGALFYQTVTGLALWALRHASRRSSA